MDWATTLSDVNYLGVVLGVVASFVVGFVWYHPKVFGEVWRKSAGLSKKDMDSKEGMGIIFGGTAVFSFISTVFLAAILLAFGTDTIGEGALHGAVIGLTIVGLRTGIHDMFSRKSLDHTMVQAGHDVVVMAIQGAIIAALI